MEKQVIYTYRYFWKTKDGAPCVKIITDTERVHNNYKDIFIRDENILACTREYLGEVDLSMIGYTDTFKTEVKEDA